MESVDQYAQFFIKNNLDDTPNTYDGNMKLQKLLFFANMISLAKNDKLLFNEKMLAFKNGTVIEEVRQKYKNDYLDYKNNADVRAYHFDDYEEDVLNATINIFGKLTAKELSTLNHDFEFWETSLKKSKNVSGFYVKERSEIAETDIRKEIPKIKKVLEAYEKNNSQEYQEYKELINGITFYYNPNEVGDKEQLMQELEDFSYEAEENSYHVYFDKEELVIL